MTKTIAMNMTIEKSSKPWWNRPIVGHKTLIDYMFTSNDSRQEIPPKILYLHNCTLQKLEKLNLTLKALFSEEFSQPDFLVFARIQSYLHKYFKEQNHYFIQSINFFTVMFAHLDTLSNLSLIESKYQTEVFTELYDYIKQLAHENKDKLIFQEKVKKRKEEIISNLGENNPKAKIIDNYTNYILLISTQPNLLFVYYSLKQNSLDNWHSFKKLRDFINHDENNNFQELKDFILVIKSDFEWLKALLINVLNIKDSNIDVINLARILQYIALNYKYKFIHQQFKRFLLYLTKWEKKYYYILSLREEYPIKSYHYPVAFKAKLPGFDLYKIYHDYLDNSYLLKKLT